jgi:hypothetical protein
MDEEGAVVRVVVHLPLSLCVCFLRHFLPKDNILDNSKDGGRGRGLMCEWAQNDLWG